MLDVQRCTAIEPRTPQNRTSGPAVARFGSADFGFRVFLGEELNQVSRSITLRLEVAYVKRIVRGSRSR